MFFELAHFESSQRGSCVLIYDGKRFTRDGKFTETTNWRCCYFRDKCRARAITREIDGVTRVRITYSQHTCVPKRVKTAKLYDRWTQARARTHTHRMHSFVSFTMFRVTEIFENKSDLDNDEPLSSFIFKCYFYSSVITPELVFFHFFFSF